MPPFLILIKPALTFCWILLFLLAFNIKTSAQLYMDVWGGYNLYQSHLPLNVKNDKVVFLPRFGVTTYKSIDQKFKISIETGPFKREFYQEFPGQEFRYRFAGWFVAPVASYQAFENFFVDAGFDLLFYNARINGYGRFNPIGKGFRGYDIGFLFGGTYYFLDWFSVGTRITPYFYKMLKYKKIGSYGEFESVKKDISTQRFEFFLRFQFLNSLNQ